MVTWVVFWLLQEMATALAQFIALAPALALALVFAVAHLPRKDTFEPQNFPRQNPIKLVTK